MKLTPKLKNAFGHFTRIALTLALFVYAGDAFAQTAQYTEGQAKTFMKTFQVVASFLLYLGGFIFIVYGLFKLKAAVEEPDRNPVKNAVALLLLGFSMVASMSIYNALQADDDVQTDTQFADTFNTNFGGGFD